jgi:hypothetical protein
MKKLKIEISKSYERMDDNNSFPCITIDNDGEAWIGNQAKNSIHGSVWHGTAITLRTKGLTAEMVKKCYEEAGKISWETKWNGSNHVGCKLSHEMQEKLDRLRADIEEKQSNIDYWGIEQCDWDSILEEQTIIEDWSQVTEENKELVAEEIYYNLFNYEDEYTVNCTEIRDILAKIDEEIEKQ